jgi:anti-anti-sigma factor
MSTVDYEKLTIYETESFHKTLLQWCDKDQKVLTLDFGRVQKIDIAAIQLLLSAQKTCHKKSSELILENLSSGLRETLRLAGCETLFKGLK